MITVHTFSYMKRVAKIPNLENKGAEYTEIFHLHINF